jgi:hypothetical protein
MDRVIAPEFQSPVHIHVRAGHVQGVTGVVEGDVGQLPEVDHVL